MRFPIYITIISRFFILCFVDFYKCESVDSLDLNEHLSENQSDISGEKGNSIEKEFIADPLHNNADV